MAGERMAWTDDVTSVQRHLARYVWALRWCRGKTVLDAGCGIGYGTALLANVCRGVEGIDSSREAIIVAQDRYGPPPAHGCMFWHTSIEKHTPCWSYDTVVAFEVLEHLENMEAGMEKLLAMTKEALLVSLPVNSGDNPYHHGRNMSVADCDAFMEGRGDVLDLCYQPLYVTSHVEVRPRPIENPDNVAHLLYVVWKGAV
jgi:trans-aconitate methyltransferase